MLATAMVGFTGLPVLIKIFQILILTAWSAAEAVTDVKTLLSGGKVPTIKQSTEWNLSIEGFKNFSGSDVEGSSSERGLEYEDYLRVLLVMQDKETQYYRTMDMIQANLCLNENEAFRISECIESVELTADFKAGQIFTAIPFVKNIIGSSGDAYTFSVTQSYGY